MHQISYRRKSEYLTDLRRLENSLHGHDGSSRIVMVRKTDQRTFASIKNGEEPKLETITRETIETFRGQRTECKITTTEKKDCEDQVPVDLAEILSSQRRKTPPKRKQNSMEFETACLDAHNAFRRKHGVQPLKLNKDMCRLSQKWANTLIKRATLEHSNDRDYGENIYCVSSNNPNFAVRGEDPVRSWYEEIKAHKFGVEPQTLSSGHFTQVVWKETREIGVAFSKLGGKIVVVANYSPPGNIIGQFGHNVLPLGGLVVVEESTGEDFESAFLETHNFYRKQHGVEPLKLDKKLCKYSEEWAKICASKNSLEHRKTSPYGENIFCVHSTEPAFNLSGKTPVKTWYDENAHHVYGREPKDLKSGHFTQVVWKSSEILGVGVAKSRQGCFYVVANYSPAGNFVGHFADNVLPLAGPSKSMVEQTKTVKKVDFGQFEEDALRVHNELRRKHGVPDLVLNKTMCVYAKDWADNCAKTGTMSHRPQNSYGENIFCSYSSDFSHVPTARDAIKKWYDEVKEHVFGADFVNANTLHFTQVVWKNSTELGIGLAKNAKGQSYVVANYSPRGNIVGQFAGNVMKTKM